ncbi:MAG: YgjV family protein [Clostridiales bacterium]|nr:YgjV family protein [Clostridiales bacterium]
MTIEMIAQAIGIIAMFFNIFSYQQKSGKGVITFQLFGASLFAVNFLMIGAFSGGLLNVIAVIRAILFLKKDKFKTDNIPWFVVFLCSYIASYVLTFTVFGKPFTVVNALFEILPVIGMVATHLAFRHDDAGIIRRFGFVSSCSWIIYNIWVLSIGAIVCEAFSIISIFIGMWRLDRKNK